MNKTLEGMAREICLAIWDHDYTPRDPLHPDTRWLQAMKAAKVGAEFLADNVTDKMAEAWHNKNYCDGWSYQETCEQISGYGEDVKETLSAALRAAAASTEEN